MGVVAAKPVVQYPHRLLNLIKRICGLKAGKYVITVTVRDNDAIFSVTEMGDTEG